MLHRAVWVGSFEAKGRWFGKISLQLFVLLLSLGELCYPSLLILAEAGISQLIRA